MYRVAHMPGKSEGSQERFCMNVRCLFIGTDDVNQWKGDGFMQFIIQTSSNVVSPVWVLDGHATWVALCVFKSSALYKQQLSVPRSQTSLSWCKFARKGRREGEKASLLLFLLPMVPCVSSPVTRISLSSMFSTKVWKKKKRLRRSRRQTT